MWQEGLPMWQKTIDESIVDGLVQAEIYDKAEAIAHPH
jgi:hypothetical protein